MDVSHGLGNVLQTPLSPKPAKVPNHVRHRLSPFGLGHVCKAAVVHLVSDWSKTAIREALSKLWLRLIPQYNVHAVPALRIKCPDDVSSNGCDGGRR